MMRLVSLLACITLACQAMAMQLSESELASATTHAYNLDKDQWQSQTADELNAYLNTQQPETAILLKHRWLRRMAELAAPSEQQRRWVEQATTSAQILTMLNPDHPEQRLVVANIARQASVTQHLWQLNGRVRDLQKRWQGGDWHWPSLLQGDNYKALNKWLKQLSAVQLSQVASHFEQQAGELSLPDNQALALMAEKSASPVLLSRLWQQAADEHSYRVLQTLPFSLDEQEAIRQLRLATRHPDTCSAAILSLARHFSANAIAQAALKRALDDPDLQWYAAASLSEIKDQAFAVQLADELEKNSSKLAKLAKSNLRRRLEK